MADAMGGRRGDPSADRVAGNQRGSIALLALMGGGLTLLLSMVPLIAAADLVVSRQRAQVAADAAALAAMSAPPAGARDAADAMADRNGAELRRCRCDDAAHREVAVAVSPASTLLRALVPHVEAEAAAALVAAHPSARTGDPAGGSPRAMPAAAGTGARVWPLAAPVTSGFGTRVHPVTGTARLHAGLDLGAPTGTPIRAAAAGTVVAAGTMGGYGSTVDLRHADGTVTRYAHQSRLLVGVGQTVAAGQVIGLVGSTGLSTAPHLHFEVRTPSGPVDPAGWFPR